MSEVALLQSEPDFAEIGFDAARVGDKVQIRFAFGGEELYALISRADARAWTDRLEAAAGSGMTRTRGD